MFLPPEVDDRDIRWREAATLLLHCRLPPEVDDRDIRWREAATLLLHCRLPCAASPSSRPSSRPRPWVVDSTVAGHAEESGKLKPASGFFFQSRAVRSTTTRPDGGASYVRWNKRTPVDRPAHGLFCWPARPWVIVIEFERNDCAALFRYATVYRTPHNFTWATVRGAGYA